MDKVKREDREEGKWRDTQKTYINRVEREIGMEEKKGVEEEKDSKKGVGKKIE